MYESNREHRVYGILIGIVTVFIACMIPLCFFLPVTVPDFIGQQAVRFDGTVTENGRTVDFSSGSFVFSKQSYEKIRVSGSFSKDIANEDVLLYFASDLTVRILRGDETLFASSDRVIEGLNGPYKRLWLAAATGHIAKGEPVTIELVANNEAFSAKTATDFFSTLAIADRMTMYQKLFSGMLLPLILYIFLILGFVVVFMVSFMTKRRGTMLRCGMLLLLMGFSGWRCVFDSCFPFVSIVASSVRTIDFLRHFPLFAAAALVSFYLVFSIKSTGFRKAAAIVTGVSTAFSAFVLVLMMTEQYDTDRLARCVCLPFAVILANMVLLFIDERRGKSAPFGFACCSPLVIGVLLNGSAFLCGATTHVYGFSLGFLATAVLRSVFAYRRFLTDAKLVFHARETENELEQSRIAIMLSQIRPHFLFNSLTAIKQLCATDPPKAEEAIDHFSRFLRRNLDSINCEEIIPFSTELDFIANYLYMEQLRVGNRLRIEYDIEDDNFRLPALTVQPIVENAVRYGVTKKPEGGTVKITTRKLDSAYLIIISDDGVGFDPASPKEDGRSHVGIANVRSRLDYQCSGTLTVASKPGEGSVATIMIPKR